MYPFIKENYHTHTTRCHHAYGTEEEYIEAAIDMGLTILGFADHVPCPFEDGYVSHIRMTMEEAEEYVATVRKAASKYREYIKVLVGFEMEYIPEFFSRQMSMCERLGVDYRIMGQHFWISEQEGPYAGTPTDDDSRIRTYVDSIIEGMETGAFGYLCHPDLIHYQGLDSVYHWEMTRLCKRLKELQIPIEMNMGGMLDGKHYPADRFWSIASEVGNKVIVGIDAHSPDSIKDMDTYGKCMEILERYKITPVNIPIVP